LHSAKNTLDLSLFHDAHPEPSRLTAARRADLGGGAVRFSSLPEWPNGALVPFSGGDVMFEWQPPSGAPRAQVVTPDELDVRRGGGGLRVTARDGRDWDVLAFFELMLPGFGAMLPFSDYSPRVTVSGVVVQRETWTLDAAALAFAREPTAAARFAAARRLAGERGFPRRVFVRAPSEPKPIFIDLESAPFVELLAWLAGKSPSLRVSEMLPAPEDCWLVDAAGAHYTSELRLVLVDPLPPR